MTPATIGLAYATLATYPKLPLMSFGHHALRLAVLLVLALSTVSLNITS